MKRKTLLAIVLSLCMVITMIPASAFAEEATVITSGNLGDNLTYSLDSDGVLTISGTGDMPSSENGVDAPWISYSRNVKSVNIENGVTSIGESMFFNHSNIESITIPDSVTSIGMYAFHYCPKITSVTIPGSVKTIGEGAFYDCNELTSIDVSTSNKYYKSVDGILFNKNATKIIQYPASKVGPSTEYSIPAGVTCIEALAFSGCENLTAITIPSGVTTIGNSAFETCKGLTSITIPSSVKVIDDWAFFDCKGLTNITIPGSVNSIGQGVFSGCKNLTDVYFEGTKAQLASKPYADQLTGYNVIYKTSMGTTTVKLSTTSYTYSGGVKTPTVTVKAADGTQLQEGEDYELIYPTGRKSVGTYKVTVQGLGLYYDKKTASFKINPKGTTQYAPAKASKAFTAKWKKQSTKMATSYITGYQVRYSTSSSMSGAKTKFVSGYSKTSTKVTGLKAKKKYYIQIRTYKTVSGVKYYSAWSAKKYVTTR